MINPPQAIRRPTVFDNPSDMRTKPHIKRGLNHPAATMMKKDSRNTKNSSVEPP